MKSKMLLSNVESKHLLEEIISYFPEKDKDKILNIFRYNKSMQKKLNISLINYQKEYLIFTFKGINPRKYETNVLYDAFKNIFDNKEKFINLIKELFPEEDEENILFYISENIEFTEVQKMSDFNKIKNLSSLELCDIDYMDLGQINSRIKNLKISGENLENKTVVMMENKNKIFIIKKSRSFNSI